MEEDEERSCDFAHYHGNLVEVPMSTSKKKANQISSIVIQAALGVILVTVAAMVFFVGIKKAYSFGYEIFSVEPVAAAPGTDKMFVVEEGTSKAQCMDNLEKAGLIRDKNIALIQEYFFEYKIYPGTYTLNTSMTIKEILAELNEKPEAPTEAESKETVPQSAAEAETKEIIEGDD